MTIFVGGAHGAGKTYIAKPVCEKLGMVYAAASQLILDERGEVTWTNDKTVSEVEPNQHALIRAVRRIKVEGHKLVLDGHVVLRTAIWEHERLDLDIFAALECTAILLVQSPASLVLARLRARDNATNWSEREVHAFSQAEISHGAFVADKLGISFALLTQPTEKEFEAQLQRAAAISEETKSDTPRSAKR